MLATALDPDTLLRRLSRAVAAVPAADLAAGDLVSVPLRVPRVAEGWFLGGGFPRVYWAQAGAQHSRLGWGEGWSAGASGDGRFARLKTLHARLGRRWRQWDPERVGTPRLAAVMFAFDPRGMAGGPSAIARVPALLLETRGSGATLTWSLPWPRDGRPGVARRAWLAAAEGQLMAALGTPLVSAAPARGDTGGRVDTPADEEWLQRVVRALDAITAGAFAKVVLTRRSRFPALGGVDPARVLHWLERHYPGCVQFAADTPEGLVLGASPERLVSLAGHQVVADALAGTVARCPRDGHASGEALLADAKLLREHRLVVRDIAAALAPVCPGLRVPEEPQVLTLPTLQHLWTPLHGRVGRGVGLFDLAARLHPTPAVGGFPRGPALAWMRAAGETARGWYTGGIGWVEGDGSGELSVVLRCARLGADGAELYAGAGIVAASDPAAELAETELKLQTMRDALAA